MESLEELFKEPLTPARFPGRVSVGIAEWILEASSERIPYGNPGEMPEENPRKIYGEISEEILVGIA